MMNKKIIKDYPNVKLIAYLSVTISILIHVAMFLSFKFGEGIMFQQVGEIAEVKKPHFHLDGFILNIIFTFVLAFVLYLYNMYIQKNAKLKDNSKLVFIIAGSIIITVIMSFVFTALHPYILGYADPDLPINRKVHHYSLGCF